MHLGHCEGAQAQDDGSLTNYLGSDTAPGYPILEMVITFVIILSHFFRIGNLMIGMEV